ncbi:hypothetical protein GCM10010992_20100 [Cloacibacterium rupense]|uniref:HTH luxR-type domain-containing protein n=2 Tax=Cloacibacterium rupense TaxID=517423 RepID=A0ABQ2NJR4_9FLAO|nr:hypothetical protein GCM10010992_20100 [Cloacibacterium rupense]
MTKEVYRLRDENNIQEIANLSRKAIQYSKKINYKKGEIYGYARLGNALCNLKKYKESLEALNTAQRIIETSNIKDNVISASIFLGMGRCYSESKTSYDNAIIQFENSLNFANRILDKNDKNLYLSIIYSNLYSVYSNMNNKNEAVKYLYKGLSIKEDPYACICLANHHNLNKNIDSAKFYLKKAETYNLNDFNKATLDNEWGKYYEEKKDYAKAILHYQSAEDLAKKINEMLILDKAYSGLYSSYHNIGNLEKAIDYSDKRVMLKDSIVNKQSSNSEITINDIVRKKEKLIHKEFSKSQKLYFILGVLVLLILSFLAFKIYKNSKEKNKVQKLIEEKEIEIKEKETLAENLQLKINDSFDELINLAKSNSPEFFTRFKEVYPEKIDALLAINDKLRVTELTLCAYIFLGFKTKDIALFTFKSINTIRNRKYNLRKKLFIEEDQDMEIWFKKL